MFYGSAVILVFLYFFLFVVNMVTFSIYQFALLFLYTAVNNFNESLNSYQVSYICVHLFNLRLTIDIETEMCQLSDRTMVFIVANNKCHENIHILKRPKSGAFSGGGRQQ